MEVLNGLLMMVIALAVYFLPTIIADRRKHHQFNAIAALNLLLGWSGLGWIAAIVWSLTATKPAEPQP